MKQIIKRGSIDKNIIIFIPDSASTTGGGKTGIAYNTSGLSCYYVRPGSAAAQLSLATQTVSGAHSDGGFVEIDATNLPGFYRLDLSDAIIAVGVDSVAMMLKGASGMAPVPIEIQLVDYDGLDGVRMGLTALPNAAADAAGGLPISDAGGLDLDTILGLITAARMGALTDWIDGGRLDLLLDALLARLTATRAGYLDELGAANIPADIDALKTGVVVTDKTGFALSSAGVAAIFAYAVEGTQTFLQWVRLAGSALFRKSAGGGTGTITFRDGADSKNRISATVDEDGNRTAVTVDGD